MNRTRAAALIASVVAFAAGARARAQGLPGETPCATRISKRAVPKATKLAEAGKEALLTARYEEALRLYRRAYCVLPTATLKHGVSVAAYDLGQCDEALDAARLWSGLANAGERAEARSWLETVEAQCVPVSIRSDPAGASVRLDSASSDLGVTPWMGRLRAGPHGFVLTEAGFQDTHEQVTIPEGSRDAPFEIAATLLSPPVPVPPPMIVVVPRPAAPAEVNLGAGVGSAVAIPPSAVRQAPAPEAPLASSRPEWRKPVGWTAVALGAAGLVIGTALGVVASADQRSVHTGDHTGSEALQLLDEGNALGAGADASLVVGGVLAGAGTLVLVY